MYIYIRGDRDPQSVGSLCFEDYLSPVKGSNCACFCGSVCCRPDCLLQYAQVATEFCLPQRHFPSDVCLNGTRNACDRFFVCELSAIKAAQANPIDSIRYE